MHYITALCHLFATAGRSIEWSFCWISQSIWQTTVASLLINYPILMIDLTGLRLNNNNNTAASGSHFSSFHSANRQHNCRIWCGQKIVDGAVIVPAVRSKNFPLISTEQLPSKLCWLVCLPVHCAVMLASLYLIIIELYKSSSVHSILLHCWLWPCNERRKVLFCTRWSNTNWIDRI